MTETFPPTLTELTVAPGDAESTGTALGVSPWIARWSHLLAPGCSVLDVACGHGRHSLWFAGRGHPVWAVDRTALMSQPLPPQLTFLNADIEAGPWPLTVTDTAADAPDKIQQFGAVVVTNYLWRPLIPTLLASLQPGGVLLYETFAEVNAAFGRPCRPDFLLHPGELLHHCNTLHTIAYENGLIRNADGTPQKMVQRIAAMRPNQALVASAADIPCAL